MKKKLIQFTAVACICITMTSCYTVSYVVGNGPVTGYQVKEKNHYLIAGLAPIKTADPVKMAGEAKDYEVTITHTFVDGLINLLTSGLYTPTTTIVRK